MENSITQGEPEMERASSPLMSSQITMPAVVQPPKGRGRPRASYAQAGEFDLDLIREYHLRPALYDRANKLFKDKEHATQLWLQIAHKTGFDVSILRDRIITLRNRYNIEKRRVENKVIEGSQWPLYEYLNFLSDHIRTRRSYKRRSKSVDKNDPDADDGDDEEHVDVHFDMNSESNGTIKAIKHEVIDNDENSEYDYDDDRQLPVTTVLSIPHSTPLNGHTNIMNGKVCRQPELFVAGVKQKRVAASALTNGPPEKRNNNLSGFLNAANAATGTAAAAGPTIEASTTYPKFRAFGEFVSHSLNELPHSVSMRLIEKFTHDLVQATIKATAEQNRDSVGEGSSLDDVDD